MQNQLAHFDQLKADITMYVAPTRSIVVADHGTQLQAMASAKDVVSWKKKVEEKRKELVAPLLEAQREINEYARSLTEPLLGAETYLKTQLIQWDRKLEAKRQEEMRKSQEETRRKEEEARKAAAAAREEAEAAAMFGANDESTRAVLVADAEAERATAQIAKDARKEEKAILENKVSGIRSLWKFEVTEIDDVPREFWIIDEAAIGRAVRGGAREIKGVRIFEEKTMGVR